MQKAGEYLKNLRQEKGITIEDVSKATKISPSILKALEDGYPERIEAVYVRGFLKLYCRFLSVDWNSFQKEYLSSFTNNQPRVSQARINDVYPKRKVPASISSKYNVSQDTKNKANGLLSGFLIKNKKIIRRLLIAASFIILAVFLLKAAAFIINRIPKNPAKGRAARIIKPRAQAQFVSSDSVKLAIRARDDTFIKVKVDGRLVYQSILRSGRFESWQAKDKIEFSCGNAARVEAEVNGKIISPLGRKGEPLKNVIITKDGIKNL